MKERLQKILSAHGISSRRAAEKLIEQGRVTVNGEVSVLGQSADITIDRIEVDGKRLDTDTSLVYIMLNKPRGYVTTLQDESGRKNVSDLVKDCGTRVHPVGRLDMDSEGLLIMTNDGSLTYLLTHPSSEKTKTYHVTVTGEIAGAVSKLSQPMVLDNVPLRAATVSMLRADSRSALLSITIHEGKNRQIRRMCALIGLRVEALMRVEEGGLQLGTLPSGGWRYLTSSEVDYLKAVNPA